MVIAILEPTTDLAAKCSLQLHCLLIGSLASQDCRHFLTCLVFDRILHLDSDLDNH